MKKSNLNNGAENRGGGKERTASGKAPSPRRRFIFGARAAGRAESQPEKTRNEPAKAGSAANDRHPVAGAPSHAANLTETIKALLHLARDQGHLTYDDINELLPDGVWPNDLDALYAKLQDLGIEIVARVEIKKAKREEPEPEEDRQSDALDDPVRIYMNQMGKVPLLTREQEVELCREEDREGRAVRRDARP